MADQRELSQLEGATQSIEGNLWKRFIGTDGIMLDYVGLNGEVVLPTPEECRDFKPNALGWWTPIENGGFFTGNYLLGQLARYAADPDPQRQERIKRLVAGLFLLQDVCSVDGLVARGVGTDGHCHYPASSNDQVIPWILALWRYADSGIPDAEERKDCRARLLRMLKALQKRNWVIAGDAPGFERGDFFNETNELECRLSNVHLLISAKILDDLEGNADEPLYRSYLELTLRTGQRRREYIVEGFPNLARGHGWFTSHSVYAIRELFLRETDPELRQGYGKALRVTGEKAAPYIQQFEKCEHSNSLAFDPDWHGMLAEWTPQSSSDEASACAMKELPLWRETSPAVATPMMHAFAAAWIVTMSENQDLIEQCLPDIVKAIQWFDYDSQFFAGFFFAENVIAELAR